MRMRGAFWYLKWLKSVCKLRGTIHICSCVLAGQECVLSYLVWTPSHSLWFFYIPSTNYGGNPINPKCWETATELDILFHFSLHLIQCFCTVKMRVHNQICEYWSTKLSWTRTLFENLYIWQWVLWAKEPDEMFLDPPGIMDMLK